MPASSTSPAQPDDLRDALRRQSDVAAHDLGLIRERLAWTPAERLDANTAFLRFYRQIRPDGPLVSDE